MTNLKSREEVEGKFDRILAPDGDTINSILAYRGVYDCGKCFKEDEEKHYRVPVKELISTIRKDDLEAIDGFISSISDTVDHDPYWLEACKSIRAFISEQKKRI